MNVLMLGWEFPPFISGGLGTACQGLTQGMAELGTKVLFVLPRPVSVPRSSAVQLVGPLQVEGGDLSAGHAPSLELLPVDVRLYPYAIPDRQILPVGTSPPAAAGRRQETSSGPGESREELPGVQSPARADLYGGDLGSEVRRYSSLASRIARRASFDVIHAHDWMTYPAGVQAAAVSHKPLVVHVHSTEFDRSGENVNPWIYDIERTGMLRADRVIAVSHLTKGICTRRYGVPAEKVHVVHNGISEPPPAPAPPLAKGDEKIVLFLGRMTMQKGPEYFVAAAQKVLEKYERVKFIMAGTGDMMRRTIDQVARLGLGHKILFAGFLRGPEVSRIFAMADLYVMPSVSEPFGIAPLEAMINRVPVIISRQSGVSEVVSHALKVDFWDIHELANKIVAVLRHPALHQTLMENGTGEARQLRWVEAARKCLDVYCGVLRKTA